MAGATRSQAAAGGLRKAMTRPPQRTRASILSERAGSPATALRPSNANTTRSIRSPSVQPSTGLKRKERESELQPAERTNIHVVVRCRGRNDREVKENSGVVVSTPGVKGTTLELSMGPNAMGNKEYHFDKVFSPAADQAIIYEDVVAPILNEDTLGLLSDAAGIIPRVLYSLFKKLEDMESSVKCSFIELYNEELRDLLSSEDGTKLKIYEDGAKKGNHGTMVQGMGETYIHSASAGIKLLQEGSYKRQVAATKCNDLSSRSHTVFTITVFVKRKTEKGEEYISSGKLNLVDLAGSENIQRSGAENKRATEAGLINKSLLTLGRVINALVDGGPHIPYRESKLTRLLQDSLGGRTKTCIIATVSPARSNLEETISTLDYAFRAKNIRNKPQINSTISKKTMLREFTTEIEKLKCELIATRQRNGVYLSSGAYEEMTIESESRRILIEEQRAKIETMEANLKNKVQELFTLTSNFNDIKKDNESTKLLLDQTEDLLEKTDIVLKNTKESLEEESMLRKAHQETEQSLYSIGTSLISTLGKSVADADGLHSKLRRRSDLHALNKKTWQSSTSEVLNVSRMVDERIAAFQSQQSKLLEDLSARMESFVTQELGRVDAGHSFISQAEVLFESAEIETKEQTTECRNEMNEVLEEIKILREDVQEKISEGLRGLSAAAERISGEVINELGRFHRQLHSSYISLGEEFKSIIDILVSSLRLQKEDIHRLRHQLHEANSRATGINEATMLKLQATLDEERAATETERTALLSEIKILLDRSAQTQSERLDAKVNSIRSDMEASHDILKEADTKFGEKMDEWELQEDKIITGVLSSESTIRRKIDDDWNHFDSQNNKIQETARAVHRETEGIVNTQMEGIATQMQALDTFVMRARSQNEIHHEARIGTLENLTCTIRESYQGIHQNLDVFGIQAKTFRDNVLDENEAILEPIENLTENIRKPLEELQSNFQSRSLTEYTKTGETPEKMQYDYPSTLPRTEPHGTLIARMRGIEEEDENSMDNNASPTIHSNRLFLSPVKSPTKAMVYQDGGNEVGSNNPLTKMNVKPTSSSSTGLREVDINVAVKPLCSASFTQSTDFASSFRSCPNEISGDTTCKDLIPPPSKRRSTSSPLAKSDIIPGASKLPQKVTGRRNSTLNCLGMIMEGGENELLSIQFENQLVQGRRLRRRPA
ncbi:kinesin-like protein bimC [Histoplasma capsulatum G186AR]|uniref:Kinesin-like protein bimC n=1 Tax=Ajellomyces capsulatus (strain G186AR / H82 / ATCC MYA-2454 / RMSCC 2432) TaxID=447093 RepID=C0NVX3_AJECG|nr:kinesin-like protein bimC [Histoplasma capsulatum G186AR]EEH04662.1 kinesin-like protein bimC [Histoplasma capsulatum G186AR]